MTTHPEIERARAAVENQQYSSAIVILRGVLKEDPGNVEAWLLLAEASNDPERAAQCLERVLIIDPGNETAQQRLDALRAPQQAEPPAVEESPSGEDTLQVFEQEPEEASVEPEEEAPTPAAEIVQEQFEVGPEKHAEQMEERLAEAAQQPLVEEGPEAYNEPGVDATLKGKPEDAEGPEAEADLGDTDKITVRSEPPAEQTPLPPAAGAAPRTPGVISRPRKPGDAPRPAPSAQVFVPPAPVKSESSKRIQSCLMLLLLIVLIGAAIWAGFYFFGN